MQPCSFEFLQLAQLFVRFPFKAFQFLLIFHLDASGSSFIGLARFVYLLEVAAFTALENDRPYAVLLAFVVS